MTVPTHDVHVTIRRLSIDGACAGAYRMEAADLSAGLESALADRLTEQGDSHTRRAGESLTGRIATAVASHVRPLMGPRHG